MKKKQLSIVSLILIIIFNISCKKSESNTTQTKSNEVIEEINVTEDTLSDISGNYKMPENTCGFELIITKEEKDYSYNIKGNDGIVDIYGKLTVSTIDGINYVNLEFPESYKITMAEGVLDSNTITIQNYGNADNEYQIFEDCDDKYMEFKKQ